MSHLQITLQVLGIALAIIGGVSFFVIVFALAVHALDRIKAKRREKVLAQKFFNNIEEFRRDFDHTR